MKNKNLKISGITSLLLAASCLSACSLPSWMGAAEEAPLSGERFAVMEDSAQLTPDSSMTDEAVDISEELTTPSGTQSSGNYKLSGNLSSVTTASAGEEPEENLFLSYPPIKMNDLKVFM